MNGTPSLNMCLNDFLEWDHSFHNKTWYNFWIFLKKLLKFLASYRLSSKNGDAYEKKCVLEKSILVSYKEKSVVDAT